MKDFLWDFNCNLQPYNQLSTYYHCASYLLKNTYKYPVNNTYNKKIILNLPNPVQLVVKLYTDEFVL